ncbi:hypothetical protein AV530_019112 [Patagioenas fasciata monilis]|uniref:Uncharacterized protein n=1 Tax=Patagioenas fasciata monilis TaxID=372326 RepID=A0A1V4KYD3_PATFA|nr:hypothetical protein AV530_019112 [Patagioenas fasciata monilis]
MVSAHCTLGSNYSITGFSGEQSPGLASSSPSVTPDNTQPLAAGADGAAWSRRRPRRAYGVTSGEERSSETVAEQRFLQGELWKRSSRESASSCLCHSRAVAGVTVTGSTKMLLCKCISLQKMPLL